MNLSNLIWTSGKNGSNLPFRTYSLNTDTPISDSIVSLVVMDKGTPYDLVRKKFLSSKYGTPKSNISTAGEYVTTINEVNSAFVGDANDVVPVESSIAFVGRLVGTPVASSSLFSLDTGNTATLSMALKHQSITNNLIFYYSFNGTSLLSIYGSAPMSSTTYDVICGTAKSGEQKFYKNAVQIGSTATSTGSLSYSGNTLITVGEDYRALSRNANTEISLGIIANRAWTTAEVYWLNENYKELVIYDVAYLPFPVPYTALTLSMAGLAQTQSLGAIALTQQNTLANANITQTQSLATVELSITTNLLIANINTDQTLINIELAQANILNTANISSAQNSDNISLIQQNIIAINELSTSTSLDNIGLIQQHLLNVSALLTTTAADNIALTQQNIISVTNLSETTSFTTPELSLANILELSNLLLTTTYSGIVLTQQNVIVVDNIVSIAALDAINLIQQNSLALNNLAVSAALTNINLGQDYSLDVTNLQSTNTLDNIILSSSIVLDINNTVETITFSTPELTAASILVISPMLHSVITSHLHLSLGGLLLEGNFIYMLGKNSNVYVVRDKKDIYTIN